MTPKTPRDTTPITSPQAPGREISVLLVDDHAIWRDGVRSILEDTEFHVVGEASSGVEAVASVRALLPRIVLLDIRMAGGDGLDALRTLKAEHPQTAVVMLTSYENPTYMARADMGARPDRLTTIAMLADDIGVDAVRINAKMPADFKAKARRVQNGARPDNVRGGQARQLQRNVSENINGISGNNQHAIEAGFHDGRDDLAEHIGVTSHQVEAAFARLLSHSSANDDYIRAAAVVGFARPNARRVRERHGMI